MSENGKIIGAIDIGTTKIAAIIGRKKANGQFEILGYGKTLSKGVKRGIVLNIEDTVNSIKVAVDKAQEEAGVKLSSVYVGIAGQHIKSMRNRGYINSKSDEIKKEDVEALIEDMYNTPIGIGEEILHIIPQSYIVDSEVGVTEPVGMSGKRLEANCHLVIGNIGASNNIKKCVNRAGLKVNKLILEPLASSRSVLTEDEKEVGVALVDIGGGTSDIAIYKDGIIQHTAVIPYGGFIVTQDIRKGCKILERQAESLKTQYGSALANSPLDNKIVTIPGITGRPPKEIAFKSLAHIIQSRMEEIIGEVIFQIETSDMKEELGAGIVLTGGGSLLRNLPQLVSFQTTYEVRIGYPNIHLTSDVIKEINQPMFSTGIGLIMLGDEHMQKKSKKESNIIEETDVSEDQKPTKKTRRITRSIFEGAIERFGKFFEIDENDL